MVWMRGVPSAVLAAVEARGVVIWPGRLEVKGEGARGACCCCVTITADSRGELEVIGSVDPPVAPWWKAPLPSIPIAADTSPSVAEETVDMPMAPMSIPPLTPPPVDDTRPPAVDIQDGRLPPAKLSAMAAEPEELGNEGAISKEFGFTTSELVK